MADDRETFAKEEAEAEEGESEVLHDLGKGLVAGFVGTIAVAIIVLLQGATGILPESNVIAALTKLTGIAWPGMGWVVLFAAGTLIGIGFASLDAHVEHVTGAGEIGRGVFFGILIWILTLLMHLPYYGTPAFDMTFLLAALAVEILYGVVMGAVYAKLNPETAPT